MRVELVKEYRFEAAHRLPRLPDGHKCKRLHGHSFRFEVRLAGEVDRETGFLIDFWDVDRAVAPMLERLDHHFLNEIDGLDNPTSEVLAMWIWRGIGDRLPLAEIEVAETADSRCAVRGAHGG